MLKKVIFFIFKIFIIVFWMSAILIYSFNEFDLRRDIYLYSNQKKTTTIT